MSARRGRILGLIPAKGGSLRFPRKNIAPLGGKPLLHWTVEAARGSGLCDRLVLSSEDSSVIDCARAAGVEVPFARPEGLARDPAGIVEVALHALEALAPDDRFDTLVILPPTSPFRSAGDIRAAHDLFLTHGGAFVMSVAEFTHTPYAALSIGADGLLTPVFPDLIGRKSGSMPRAYRPNGALHILDVARFRDLRSYFAPPLVPYVMPRARSIDIDRPEDLIEAECRLAGMRARD